MKDFNFKYKPFYEKSSIKKYFLSNLERIIRWRYNNKIFKKLKLNRNPLLSHIYGSEKRREDFYNIFKLNLPDLEILPFSFTFTDTIEIEKINLFKSELTQLVSKHDPGLLSGQPSTAINKALEKFTTQYKGTGWGKIYFNNLRKNKKLDLIDGISYEYIKGDQSHLIINYIVYPTQKFKELFKSILNIEPTGTMRLEFNSLKRILNKKRLVATVHQKPVFSSHILFKLYNEINFQCKSFLSTEISCGIFLKEKKYLFPAMICHTYDPNLYKQYAKKIFQLLDFTRNSNYFDDISKQFYSIPYVNLNNKSSQYLQYFIPSQTEIEKEKNPFDSASYLSENYSVALAPSWFLINLTGYLKTKFVKNRIETFKYISRKNDTLFLKKALALKRKLTTDWFVLHRLSNDFSSKITNHYLHFLGVPDALKEERFKDDIKTELKKDLGEYTKNTTEDLKNTFTELQDVFKQISEDYNTRANMRLQFLLLMLAILGIVLTIYSANAPYFNEWLKYFITQILHFKIPHPPL